MRRQIEEKCPAVAVDDSRKRKIAPETPLTTFCQASHNGGSGGGNDVTTAPTVEVAEETSAAAERREVSALSVRIPLD